MKNSIKRIMFLTLAACMIFTMALQAQRDSSARKNRDRGQLEQRSNADGANSQDRHSFRSNERHGGLQQFHQGRGQHFGYGRHQFQGRAGQFGRNHFEGQNWRRYQNSPRGFYGPRQFQGRGQYGNGFQRFGGKGQFQNRDWKVMKENHQKFQQERKTLDDQIWKDGVMTRDEQSKLKSFRKDYFNKDSKRDRPEKGKDGQNKVAPQPKPTPKN